MMFMYQDPQFLYIIERTISLEMRLTITYTVLYCQYSLGGVMTTSVIQITIVTTISCWVVFLLGTIIKITFNANMPVDSILTFKANIPVDSITFKANIPVDSIVTFNVYA